MNALLTTSNSHVIMGSTVGHGEVGPIIRPFLGKIERRGTYGRGNGRCEDQHD